MLGQSGPGDGDNVYIDFTVACNPSAAIVHGLMRELAEHQNQGAAITVSIDRMRELLTRPEITYLIAERGVESRAAGES
ncbi:hypothetical protein ACFLIM_23815 [Nonomuraea sp. M3C6]|uniref:STAS domain-containing protein n=1 Tax=Nonomuraea marmarensis TaxID=3351344 RepID=A0ABW7AIH3_9ACTN